MFRKKIIYLSTFLFITSFFISPAYAENLSAVSLDSIQNKYRFESNYTINNTITKDYKLVGGLKKFSVNFQEGTTDQNFNLHLGELDFSQIPNGKTVDEKGNIDNLERISIAYEYVFSSIEEIKDFKQTIALDLEAENLKDYSGGTMMNRQLIYYWNEVNNVWQPLPTVGDIDHNSLRAKTTLNKAIIAIFISKDQSEAYASWYGDSLTPSSKYNGASNVYKIGSYVNICRLDNLKKCVKIKIVSTGPYVDNRIVDLTKTAFKAIGNPGGGIVGVRVTPIK